MWRLSTNRNTECSTRAGLRGGGRAGAASTGAGAAVTGGAAGTAAAGGFLPIESQPARATAPSANDPIAPSTRPIAMRGRTPVGGSTARGAVLVLGNGPGRVAPPAVGRAPGDG